MKNIQEFRLDTWVEKYQATVRLQGSAVNPLSLAELHKLAPEGTPGPVDQDLVLSYGDVQGTLKLRERIAELHSAASSPSGPEFKLTAANVIITPGSIMANYLALTSLVGPGDHVICQYPTFPQLWVVPRFQGAEVSLWRLRRGETSWEASLDELRGLVKENTKVIIINNPNNPTGAVLPASTLHSLIALAAAHNITLYSDEVFRPLFHGATPSPPPLISLGYANTLSTGSVSKALGLPGVRVGWVVARDRALLARIANARHYTTIAVSQLDEGVAAFALSPAVLPRIVARNLDVCARAIALLRAFVARNPDRVQWIAPAGAGTAFVRVLEAAVGGGGAPVDDGAFAARVLAETGVGIVPGGYCFEDGEDEELKGYVRIAIGDEERLREGLEGLERVLRSG
ncbi:pyridoxal phosphate-dependent transferase [Podospora appendiculata]|uniref:Pyridoxal phosphate-dependent transferase n=1 Tax=Podospora appendiculata TaxID=314037 RepID=A0AAE0X5G5_9PEZI|nr:pyridoxal phosphate-dependent transferase [Podospora appendiculata]